MIHQPLSILDTSPGETVLHQVHVPDPEGRPGAARGPGQGAGTQEAHLSAAGRTGRLPAAAGRRPIHEVLRGGTLHTQGDLSPLATGQRHPAHQRHPAALLQQRHHASQSRGHARFAQLDMSLVYFYYFEFIRCGCMIVYGFSM